MLVNSDVTIYHKILDEETRLEKWIRYNYNNVWFFGGKGASINKGYDNANNANIRIFYSNNSSININNFAIGDIIVQGKIENDIQNQEDLSDYLIYNITSINNNNFGNSYWGYIMSVKMQSKSVIEAHLGIDSNGRIQKFFTNECARRMDKYVPFDRGILAKYYIDGNKIVYHQIYARYQYMGISKNGNKLKYQTDKHPLATSYWDKEMWSAEK